ncbi:MAG: hypothetical protein REI11_06905, partial [Patulibacter sp.]|nr:hypothetical protein [Patulibacter sp.]
MGIDSPKTTYAEATLVAIARHGIVTWSAARSAGLTQEVIRHRVATGFLVREGRGTYRLAGVERCGRTAETAALAITEGRALGLWSANSAHGLSNGIPASLVHVVVDHRRRPRAGSWYRVHRARRLAEDEIHRRDGRPVTTVPRTLRDFAACLPATDWA